MPLQSLKVGDRVQVLAYRGDDKDRPVGQVVNIRDTVREPLTWLTKYRNKIQRSRYLATVQYTLPQGQYGEGVCEEHRAYYTEFLQVVPARQFASLWKKFVQWVKNN
jgi:hypothetical protein